jgi:hypothetical protein
MSMTDLSKVGIVFGWPVAPNTKKEKLRKMRGRPFIWLF